MSTITLNCSTCEAEIAREVPEGTSPALIRWAQAHPWMCATCIEADERQRQTARDAAADRELRDRVRISGLPELHHRRLITLDHEPELVDACTDWATGRIRGLVLTGPVGAGKTTLAGAAAYRMLDDRSVVWAPVSLLFARLSTGFGSEPHRWAIEALTGNAPIVLDDLDKTRPSEYAAEQVFTAIDRRVEHGIPLLVTTNLRLSGIAEKYPDPFGESIASRLAGYCRLLTVGGDDRRVTNRESTKGVAA